MKILLAFLVLSSGFAYAELDGNAVPQHVVSKKFKLLHFFVRAATDFDVGTTRDCLLHRTCHDGNIVMVESFQGGQSVFVVNDSIDDVVMRANRRWEEQHSKKALIFPVLDIIGKITWGTVNLRRH